MDKTIFFWSGWEPVMRILVVGTLTYMAIIFILRVSGKRTLAKMNAFDFIITVALGSAFGRILTAKGVAISEAITAFVLLAFLQFVFAYVETRSVSFKKLVTSPPTLLFHKGDFLKKNLKKERLNEREVMGAARKKGFASLEEIEVIILEADGRFSVIGRSKEAVQEKTYAPMLEK